MRRPIAASPLALVSLFLAFGFSLGSTCFAAPDRSKKCEILFRFTTELSTPTGRTRPDRAATKSLQSESAKQVSAQETTSISERRLPLWAKLNPTEQFQRYGVLFAPWKPNLSESQVRDIHDHINLPNRFPRGEIYADNVDALPFSFAINDALKKYVRQIEEFLGRRADGIILRTEQGQQVFGGHRHRQTSFATASITLIGPGTFVKVGQDIYHAGPFDTVVFVDGDNPIFHGTPGFLGPRVFIGVSFLN